MELAEFEKILDSVDSTIESTHSALFGNKPSANAIVAIVEEKIIGAAIYFFNYSTFVGKRGLYLEDIYITPEYRGNGIGTKILKHLELIARDKKVNQITLEAQSTENPKIVLRA